MRVFFSTSQSPKVSSSSRSAGDLSHTRFERLFPKLRQVKSFVVTIYLGPDPSGKLVCGDESADLATSKRLLLSDRR